MTENEFFLLHSIYGAIVEKELGHSPPLPRSVEEALAAKGSAASDQPAPESLQQWLAVLDLAVNPHKLRSYVMEQDCEEPTLLASIRFLVSKKTHSEADRDKLDWVITHLFKKREERRKSPTGWPKTELQEILQGFEFPALTQGAQDFLMEIPSFLDEIKYYEGFHQITDSRIIERGRDLKNQLGDEFFHPDVLAAIVNYNLLFGKRFYELLQESAQKVREFARAQPERSTPDTKELLQSDYRSTGDAFRHLGEIGRKETALTATEAATVSSPGTFLEQQLKHLGVDSAQEALYLWNRTHELEMRLRSNLAMTNIPNAFAPLPLHDWEASAFRTPHPENEQTFRADFARCVCRAIAILSRIYEEIPLYLEKKSTEYLWKKHYDALVSLLYEGRKHKEALLELSTVSHQRGLPEKARQLQVTAEKLEASLSKVAALF